MNKRLLSLDVMRGLTVFLMILVNNGVGHIQFTQLQHSAWNGLTLCDLVFPFFLFMVGVSVWLSRKSLTPRKIFRRTVRMFLVGVLLHVWDMLIDGQWTFWHDLRLWGVLQRIALCYCAAAFLVLYVKPQRYVYVILTLLAGYAILLCLGHGYAPDESNVLCRVDRWLIGPAHLYHKSPIDPEGLLGTLPGIAHTLIGVLVGREIKMLGESEGLVFWVTSGALMTGCGLLLALWLPLNKRIWSPSYVLVTCGLATLLLLALVYTVDTRAHNRWCRLFQMFGTNAFFLYVLSEMLAPVANRFGVSRNIYEALLSGGLDPRMASLCYALLFDGVIALAAWALWKRQIFVKI